MALKCVEPRGEAVLGAILSGDELKRQEDKGKPRQGSVVLGWNNACAGPIQEGGV